MAQFLRSVVLFTVGIEVIGALLLWPAFAAHGEPHALWQALFHSVSAFCTAGFSTFNDSLTGYAGNAYVNTLICILGYSGALGFIVVTDFWRKIRHPGTHLSFTSRVILKVTAAISVLGFLSIYLLDESLLTLDPDDRFLAAFFQAMTATTTVGFNTVNVAGLSHSTVFILYFLMIVGASPSGTGGGLKSTTVATLFAQWRSVLTGARTVAFGGHRIPDTRVHLASAQFFFYVFVLGFGVFGMSLWQAQGLEEVFSRPFPRWERWG